MKLTAMQKDGWPTINSHRKPVREMHHTAALNLNIQSQWLLTCDWFQPEPRLATLLTPVVIGRKYLPPHPVAGTCDHI